MFIGFLIVMRVLAPFFLFFQFLFPALVARGKAEAAFGLFILFYIALYLPRRFRPFPRAALSAVAHLVARHPRRQQRSWLELRRRRSRPLRAVFDDDVHRVSRGTATPLWNSRWNAMSFGPLEFRATLNADGLKKTLGANLSGAHWPACSSAIVMFSGRGIGS